MVPPNLLKMVHFFVPPVHPQFTSELPTFFEKFVEKIFFSSFACAERSRLYTSFDAVSTISHWVLTRGLVLLTVATTPPRTLQVGAAYQNITFSPPTGTILPTVRFTPLVSHLSRACLAPSVSKVSTTRCHLQIGMYRLCEGSLSTRRGSLPPMLSRLHTHSQLKSDASRIDSWRIRTSTLTWRKTVNSR